MGAYLKQSWFIVFKSKNVHVVIKNKIPSDISLNYVLYRVADWKPSWFTTFKSKKFHVITLNAMPKDITIELCTGALNGNRLGLELLIPNFPCGNTEFNKGELTVELYI